MTALGDRCFLWLVWLLAWTAFIITVIACCSEYFSNPFTVVQNFDRSIPPEYAMFPDVIICTHTMRENVTDPSKLTSGVTLPFLQERSREDDVWASSESPSKPTPNDFLLDCFVKNYFVNLQGSYFKCRNYFKPYFHSMHKRCLKMLIPNEFRRIAAGNYPGSYVGIRVTLFLDIEEPPSSTLSSRNPHPDFSNIPANPPAPQQPSSLAGVKIGLQASEEDWLSDVTWVHTPPGGHSVNIGFRKVQLVKLSDSRSKFCRDRDGNSTSTQHDPDSRSEVSSSKSCRKFVHYDVETQKTKFPTAAFGPIILSKMYLDSKNQENESLSYFHSRLKTLVETEPLENVYRKFLHLHIFSTKIFPEVREEKTWYTKYKLVSNIAGCLGMFLGFSLSGTLCKWLNEAFLLAYLIKAKMKRTNEIEVYANHFT